MNNIINFNYLVDFINKCIDKEEIVYTRAFEFIFEAISILFTYEYIEIKGDDYAYMKIPHKLSYDEIQILNKLVERVKHLNEFKIIEQLEHYFD